MAENTMHVTLPSNASMDRFPKNTGGSYTVQLPETLHFNSSWEVGLSEIIFNQDWPTVNPADIWIRVDKYRFSEDEEVSLLVDNTWKTTFWKVMVLRHISRYIGDDNTADKILEWMKPNEALSILEFIRRYNTYWSTSTLGGKDYELIFRNGQIQYTGQLGYNAIKSNPSEALRELLPHIMFKSVYSTSTDTTIKGKWPVLASVDFDKLRLHRLGEVQRMPKTIPADYKDAKTFVTNIVIPLIKKALESTGAASGAKVSIVDKTLENGLVYNSLKIETTNVLRWRLEMSPILLRILGFNRSQLIDDRFFRPTDNILKNKPTKLSEIISKNTLDLDRALSSLWIYTDLISPHIVGHINSPLLRVVGIDKKVKAGVTRVLTFTHPHYYPLSQYSISEIQISIYNIFGEEPIEFQSPVMCQLHFHKRSSTLLPYIRPREAEEGEDGLQKKRLKLEI